MKLYYMFIITGVWNTYWLKTNRLIIGMPPLNDVLQYTYFNQNFFINIPEEVCLSNYTYIIHIWLFNLGIIIKVNNIWWHHSKDIGYGKIY